MNQNVFRLLSPFSEKLPTWKTSGGILLYSYVFWNETISPHLNMILGDVEETVTTVEIDDETYEEIVRTYKGEPFPSFCAYGVLFFSPPPLRTA
ncbi:hypothetical protein Leryth_027540 [Lithospermum erythrorhizon]|nr:hypothetical protein Leryth_027540 [Lithospermum erythrorhizon]